MNEIVCQEVMDKLVVEDELEEDELEEDELEEDEDEISEATSVLAVVWHRRMCALNADCKYDVPRIENLEFLMEKDQTAFKDCKTQEVHFNDMLEWSIVVSSVKEDWFYPCKSNKSSKRKKDYIMEEQFYDESSDCDSDCDCRCM